MNVCHEDDTGFVPDLAQYAAIIKEDEKKDTKYQTRLKLRIHELRMKYSQVDPKNERFADTVGGITGSMPCRIHCYSRTDVAWSFKTSKQKRAFIARKLHGAGGKITTGNVKPKAKCVVSRKLRKLQIPLVYISTVSGITYLHPVSRSLLQEKRKAQQLAAVAEMEKTITKRTLLIPTSADKKQKALSPQSSPKCSLTVIESPDEDAESESDGLDDSPFNTKKLNIQYSLEKIRVARVKRNKEKKDEANFFEVLKKYYRMQSVLKAFSKKGKKARGGFAVMPRKRFGAKAMQVLKKKSEPITLGKLKWFKFLDAKKTSSALAKESSTMTLKKPFFETNQVHLFRENLERALDEFVVRKEVVISDHSAKASVSITFTKKSVFSKSKGCLIQNGHGKL